MLGFCISLLRNNEIRVLECRGDFIAGCWVMLLDSAVEETIHDFGAGGTEAP